MPSKLPSPLSDRSCEILLATPSNPSKMAVAIIEAIDNPTDALRLVLGSDVYTNITTALFQRLNQVEDQRLSAPRTDFI